MKIEIRELDPAETDEMLRFRNSHFGVISRQHWDAMGCTAVVARKGREYLGAIPLQYREFMINDRVSIPVVFENAVLVSEKSRGTGIGTAMLDNASDFLRDRVDAFYVYRGRERSAGYRFYRKTHHGDLYFQDTLTLVKPGGADNDIEVHNWEKTIALESQLLSLFKACYRGYGGYWRRERGYFKRVVNSHIYKNRDCRLFLARRKENVVGYAITNPRCKKWPGYCIYDIAAPEPRIMKKLLAKIEFMACKAKLPVTIPCNCEHPLYETLLNYNFEAKNNTPCIMARILRPDRIFARLAKKSFVLSELKLQALTPHRDVVLNEPEKAKNTVTIYLKEAQLSRLLSCRLDFANAVETNLIRITPIPQRIKNALDRIFRFSPWVSFGMDYV